MGWTMTRLLSNSARLRTGAALTGGLLLVACTAGTPASPDAGVSKGPGGSSNYTFDNLSAEQGFNFQRDRQDSVGHVTALKIGETAFEADIPATDPVRKSGTQVVAVLNAARWAGGVSDPIDLSGNLSTQNKQNLQALLQNNLGSVAVEVAYAVYVYDPMTRAYYAGGQGGTANAPLRAIVQKQGQDLLLTAGERGQVPNPENWDFTLGIMPAGQHSLTFSTAPGRNVIRRWGLTEG
jgi:hypothetical protein